MLDGTGHAVQHVAVDLGLPPLDLQGHALVGVLAGLTHHTVEAVVDGRELHHPHAHQALLQTAAHLPLPRQVLHGGIQGAQRVLLHGGHVVDRFGQHPRHFLEAGVAVELQRVEFRLGLVGVGDLGLDLVVGLDLDLAQLQAQAVDVLGQLVDGAPDQAHLAVQTCPGNGHLAGLGHHAVQQVGAHADHVLGRSSRVGRATHRRIQKGATRLGRIMCMAIRSGLGGRLSSLLACQGLALRQRCSRLGLRRSSSLGRRLLGLGSLGRAGLLQGLGLGSTLLGQLGMQHHLVGGHGLVIAGQHRLDDRRLHRRLGQRILDLGFQFVDHLTEAHGTGHPGAALDGVEEPHQRARNRTIGRTLAPFAQVVVHLRHQLLGFLEEHRAQVRIDLVDQAGQRIALFLGLAPGSPQHFGSLLQQVLAAHLAAGLRLDRRLGRLAVGVDLDIPVGQQRFHARGRLGVGRRLDARSKFGQHPVDDAQRRLHAGLHAIGQRLGHFALLHQQLFHGGGNAAHLDQPHVTRRAHQGVQRTNQRLGCTQRVGGMPILPVLVHPHAGLRGLGIEDLEEFGIHQALANANHRLLGLGLCHLGDRCRFGRRNRNLGNHRCNRRRLGRHGRGGHRRLGDRLHLRGGLDGFGHRFVIELEGAEVQCIFLRRLGRHFGRKRLRFNTQ